MSFEWRYSLRYDYCHVPHLLLPKLFLQFVAREARMSQSAIIVGASGGIGGAVADALDEEGRFAAVHRFSRSAAAGFPPLDITNEDSIAAAAKAIASGGAPPPDLILVATGLLHDETHGPEKNMGMIEPDWMARQYAVNCIGPALIAKHFLPLMPAKARGVFAAIGARVGSISDNRTGGWYGYRASKAALAMTIRNLAIEQARRNPASIIVALHPGTVDTPLSRPFQGSVAPGKLFAPDRAALQLLDVIDGLRPADSGKHFAWDGTEVPA